MSQFIRNHPDMSQSQPSAADDFVKHCISAARNIHTLLNSYRSMWPFEQMPMTYLQWIIIAMFALIQDLYDMDSRSAFVDLYMILKGQARRCLLAQRMLHGAISRVKQMETVLPEEIMDSLSNQNKNGIFTELDAQGTIYQANTAYGI
jgi:hypothetical protein